MSTPPSPPPWGQPDPADPGWSSPPPPPPPPLPAGGTGSGPSPAPAWGEPAATWAGYPPQASSQPGPGWAGTPPQASYPGSQTGPGWAGTPPQASYPGSQTGPGWAGYPPAPGYPYSPANPYPPPGYPGYAYPPGYPGYPAGWGGPPPWKGAKLGRPAAGPGSLADPWRRFVARLLDGVIFLPFLLVLGAVALLIFAPHFGPIFPTTSADNGPTNAPGFLWLELTVVGVGLVSQVIYVVYDALCTAHWGRTPGKAVLHIRPIKMDGGPMSFWLELGRAGATAGAGLLSWIGLIDPLWCLWDENRQCLHDKIVSTIVVQD